MDTATYYTGIDLHKKTAFLTTVDEDGTVAQQQKLPCRRDALRLYFRRQPARAHHAVVETTSGWYWVSDLLREEGIPLSLAHAKCCKRSERVPLGCTSRPSPTQR